MEISDFRIEIDPELSEETKEIARKELRECEEIAKEAEEELRKLIEQDEGFTFPEDPYFLKIFLRPCKYYPESAFNLIKQVLIFRDKYKATVQGLMPKDEKDAFVNYNLITIFKDRDQKGRRILLIRGGGDWDPDKVTADQVFRMLYLLHLCAMLEPETQIRGIVVMFDLKGMSMKHVVAHGPSAIFRLLTFAQNAMPLRLKEVHVVNQPFIFNMIWSIVNPLLKEKLRKRIHFHSSKMESLHKFLEPSHLPKNYAGNLPKMNYGGAEYYPSIEKYLDHFEKWNQIAVKKK